MSDLVKYRLNQASVAEINEHLSRCDADFVPPLTGRVEIKDYAKKIAAKAARFEAWSDSTLVGLVAAYCNDSERRAAYITSVSVLQEWQGKSIASQLMERCIGHAKKLGFERIELEVDSQNIGAVKLYEKMGFIMSEMSDWATIMHLNIGKDV